jgi:hypothetical protein
MSIPPRSKSNSVDILINVSVNAIGVPSYSAFYLLDGSPATDPIEVKVGDRVGWFVRVLSNDLQPTLPYELTFANTAFFGVASLPVPQGGGSAYLQVLPNIASIGNPLKTKYSLSVVGISPTFDPEMQTDSSGSIVLQGLRADGDVYEVNWQPGADMTYTKNGAAQAAWPLNASAGDTIQFSAAVPAFGVVFEKANRYWQSPFDPFATTFQSTIVIGNDSSTAPLTVGKVTDSNRAFNFYATTPDGDQESEEETINVAPLIPRAGE